MPELSSDFLNEIANYIDERIVSADYTIDSVTRDINFRRSIVNGSTITKHVYLTAKDPTGVITRVRLKDKDGKVLAQSNARVEHEVNKGRLLDFKFNIKEG